MQMRWPLLILIVVVFFGAAARVRSLHVGSGGSWESMRPSPSLDLPVVDLIEPVDHVFDPPLSDLDPRTLRQLMGAHWDPRYMSSHQPLESKQNPNGTLDFSFKHNKKGRLVPVGSMPRDIRRIKFNPIVLPDGRRLRTNVNGKLKRKFQQFLWAYTACPVLHVWKELGVRFWPRWIREGHCVPPSPQGPPPSCSFPRGMTCKPSKSTSRVLLRWHCLDWDVAVANCSWIHIRYPIITGCTCSC